MLDGMAVCACVCCPAGLGTLAAMHPVHAFMPIVIAIFAWRQPGANGCMLINVSCELMADNQMLTWRGGNLVLLTLRLTGALPRRPELLPTL